MKILISSSYYSPHISGLTNSIKNLSELLSEKGYEVTVLTTQHRKDLKVEEKLQKIKVKRIPHLFKFHKGFFMPSFIFAVFRQVKKVDMVIINLPQFEGFLVAIIARFVGKKVICIYACDVTLGQGFVAKMVESALRVSNLLSMFLADNVITLTDDFAKNISVLFNTKKKIHAIYPVVAFPTIDLKIREEMGERLPKKRYYIGFIGRIAAEKGVEYLLKASEFLQTKLGKGFIIVLAGPKEVIGEDIYQEKISKIIAKYQDNVFQMGALEDQELGAFYSLLDVLVLPSINSTEAFGITQVEAMLCGTPVVATNLPGVRMPIKATGMGEIVEVKNSIDLAQKILKVIKNKNNYLKKRKFIEKIFSRDKIFLQYEEIINNKYK